MSKRMRRVDLDGELTERAAIKLLENGCRIYLDKMGYYISSGTPISLEEDWAIEIIKGMKTQYERSGWGKDLKRTGRVRWSWKQEV